MATSGAADVVDAGADGRANGDEREAISVTSGRQDDGFSRSATSDEPSVDSDPASVASKWNWDRTEYPEDMGIWLWRPPRLPACV